MRAIAEAYRLKDEIRSGWELRGVREPESVSDHSWGTAYLVLLYADQAGADRSRSLEIAVVHDLAEALTGDIPSRHRTLGEGASKKYRAERDAMERLTARYDSDAGARVRGLWAEYEARHTIEARFVRDMNLIDMCLQAYVYESDGRYEDVPNPNFREFSGLDEFFATTAPRLDLPLGRELFAELLDLFSELPSVRERGGVRIEPGD